ncbi:MAG: class I SAM-dependent methyltransferase [Crinalium sp.]
MARPVHQRILGKLFPKSKFGQTWYKQGDFITFKTEGFVAAPSIPALMARNFYEVKYLRRIFKKIQTYDIKLLKSLEIGCGYGRLSPFIAEFFEEHYAVDINKSALDTARSLYPSINFSSTTSINFIEASATELPFQSQTFDCIITWTVLQHILPPQIDSAIAEINRVVKEKGFIILCETTPDPEKVNRSAHTDHRLEEFYVKSFPSKSLILSTYLNEIDRVESIAMPGRLMVFAPKCTSENFNYEGDLIK